MAGDGRVRINMEEGTLAECGVHYSQKPALLSGAFPRAGTQRPRRAVSSLIPPPKRLKWRAPCVEFLSEGTSVFNSAGSRDAADRKWMQTVGMQSL